MKLTVTLGDNVLFDRDVECCTTEENAGGAFTVSAVFPAMKVDPIDAEFDRWISSSKILDVLLGAQVER